MVKNRGYALPDDITPDESIYVCIPIPDSPGHRRAFAGALHELARWWNWEKDDAKRGKDAANVWFPIFRSVMVQMDQRLDSCGGDGDCPDGTTRVACTNYSGCGGLLVIDESEDEMSNQFIYSEEFNPPRIGVNCGCGTIKWFNLSPVSDLDVMVDKTRPDKAISPSTKFAKIVSPANQSCYAESAVAWIFSRAVDMHSMLVDAATLGIDSMAGEKDELVEWALLLVDLFNGANDLWNVVGRSKGQVAAIFADQDLIDTMVAAWTFEGEVTRQELDLWIENAPGYTWGVPVRLLLYTWMVYGMFSRYNQHLELLAAECESGYSLETGGIPGAGGSGGGAPGYTGGAVETTIEDSGDTFPVWTWTFDPQFVFYDTGDRLDLIDVGGVIAIGFTVQQLDDDYYTHLRINDDRGAGTETDLFAFGSGEQLVSFETTVQSRYVLEASQGVADRLKAFSTDGTPLYFTFRQDQGQARLALRQIVIVGEALP